MKLIPYLMFNGTCKEALNTYASALGGSVTGIMTYGQAPAGTPVSPGMEDKVMNAQLDFHGLQIMASDAPPDRYVPPAGNFVSIGIETPAEADRLFEILSAGGDVIMPSQRTFWTERFSMFTDRFGTPWMINCDQPPSA